MSDFTNFVKNRFVIAVVFFLAGMIFDIALAMDEEPVKR